MMKGRVVTRQVIRTAFPGLLVTVYTFLALLIPIVPTFAQAVDSAKHATVARAEAKAKAAAEAKAKAAAEAKAKAAAESKAAHKNKPSPTPTGFLNILNFGGNPNGKFDNQAAFAQVIAAAKAADKGAFIPEGTFLHSGTIVLNAVSMLGTGGGTVIAATNPSQGAIKLTGKNGGISSCTISYANVGSEDVVYPSLEKCAIWIQSASCTVNHVNILNAPSDAIDVIQSSNVLIENTLVKSFSNNANAIGCGIYVNQSNGVQILNNSITSPNLLGFPLNVGYDNQGPLNNNLSIQGNTFNGFTSENGDTPIWLFGITNSVFDNNNLVNCPLAIAGNAGGGGSVNALEVKGNTINVVQTNWAVYISSSDNGGVISNLVSDVQFLNNTIKNVSTNTMQIGGALNLYEISGLTVSGNTINGAVYGINALLCSNVVVSNNTISNVKKFAMTLDAMPGTLKVSANKMSKCCENPQFGSIADWSDQDVIALNPSDSSTSLEMINNDYSGPANGAQDFIFMNAAFPNETITGNTTETLLPSVIE